MARSAPTVFAQRNETALVWTAEFKAFSGAAGAITTPMAVQQGKDWDLIMLKVLPTPTGPMAYTKAEMDDMFVNRGARTVPLMFVGYGNDGPVAITDEPPTQAPPYGPTTAYESRVHWDPEWYLYDVPFDSGWNNATRLQHVVRVTNPSSGAQGVFVLDLEQNTLRSAMWAYYQRDLNPDNLSYPVYDAACPDVMGPNNVPNLTSLAGGDYTGYTKKSYVERNAKLAAYMRDAAAATAAAEKLPVCPNGIVNGSFYFDAAAGGNGYTQQLLAASDLAMVELFVRGENAAWDAWPSNAVLEDNADMLVHAENSMQKGLLCMAHLWSNYGTSEATYLAHSKQVNRVCFGIFLLGAAGRSYYCFNDSPDGTHRALDYPTGAYGTPTSGRRRQFQSQFYAGDRWYDRVKLGLPLTSNYTKAAHNTAGNAVTGLYERKFEKGQVWVNNTGSPVNVYIAGVDDDRYVEFSNFGIVLGAGTPIQVHGASLQVVPSHNSLILSRVSGSGGGGGTYTVDAASDINAFHATLHASTTDPTSTGVFFDLSDGSAHFLAGASPYSLAVTGLAASTGYTVTARFVTDDGEVASGNSVSFSTIADIVAPTWVDATPRATVTAGRILIDSFKATDEGGVVKYIVTRTGGAGTRMFEVFEIDRPFLSDTAIVGTTAYSYSIVARDAAGNTSTAVTVGPVTAIAADGVNTGPFLRRLRGR